MPFLRYVSDLTLTVMLTDVQGDEIAGRGMYWPRGKADDDPSAASNHNYNPNGDLHLSLPRT